MVNKNRRITDKISFFSIGAKLVTIVSIIVLVSLGSITVLVSWLVREDLRVAAEENNFEINRRSAADAEQTITKTRSDALILIRTLSSITQQRAQARDTTEFFFEQYPNIAEIFFTTGGEADQILVNDRFFLSRGTDASLADSYRDNNAAPMQRAVLGETLLLNAATHFSIPLLALFFPWQNGGAAVLFSSEDLNESFGFGPNKSYP